jgi:hypothetical protein
VSRADSPLRDRMVFAFGARRSGTWWLQRILTAHPEVSAVPSETYLFELGIRPLLERFHHGAKSSATVAQMHAGRDELLDATREFCDRMLAPFLEPGARFLSERSPGHAKALDVIGAVYPDARQIHIIRDGRDVARSLAARSWGPGGVADAARDWREHVEAARANAGEQYLEVRYEELLADLEPGIRRLYAWLGLEAADALVAEAAAEARRPLNQDPKDPRIATGKWRSHFGAAELAAFEAEAGGLLAELGYAGEPGGPRASAPVPARAETRAPAEPEAARVSVARRWLSRVRRLAAGGGPASGPAADPAAAAAGDVGGRMAEVQRLADRLLTYLHAGNRDGIAELLEDDATLRVVGPDGGETSVSGREAVAAALAADEAWRQPQLRGEAEPGLPRFSLAMAYRRGSGVAWRMLYLEAPVERIRVLTVYALDGRAA